jgi:hypothetical protein
VDAIGPGSEVSTFVGPKAAAWWIRRRLHEATVHRADAAIALGVPYELSAELAADGISEWLERLADEQALGQPYGAASRSAMYTSSMADPITFRPTVEDTENLAILTADGTSPTHAIRHALEIAAHNKRQEDLRADAARLAANPEYQAEIRAVREELDELRAW